MNFLKSIFKNLEIIFSTIIYLFILSRKKKIKIIIFSIIFSRDNVEALISTLIKINRNVFRKKNAFY